MHPALAPPERRRIAAKDRPLAPARTGDRLSWPRAALFVLGLCAALWLSLGYLVTRLLG